uniref:Uncharacterized protein n=1 Tax=Catagonus wagneri TaxID=51154 RepID=A0A8C3YHH8_9CETA
MRATREKSHSQLGGACISTAVEKPVGLGSQVGPSHLATPSWEEDLLCARASPECREETSLNVPSRGNCIPPIRLLDSGTNTTDTSPLLSCEKEKTCSCETWGSLGTWCVWGDPFSEVDGGN